jgi:hypothetical protein
VIAKVEEEVGSIANAIGQWIAPPVTPDKRLKALGKG